VKAAKAEMTLINQELAEKTAEKLGAAQDAKSQHTPMMHWYILPL